MSHHGYNNTSVNRDRNLTGRGIMADEQTENLRISIRFDTRTFPFRNKREQ